MPASLAQDPMSVMALLVFVVAGIFRAGEVVAMVLKRGMLTVAAGGVLGGVLAVLGARALSGVLYVGALDPASFAAAFAVLAAVAVLAHWIPARRASAVDPALALRSE